MEGVEAPAVESMGRGEASLCIEAMEALGVAGLLELDPEEVEVEESQLEFKRKEEMGEPFKLDSMSFREAMDTIDAVWVCRGLYAACPPN